MRACHGKHRAVDLLARSRDHYGRPDGGSEQHHESCELSRRGCSKMPTLRFRDQEIAKYLDASDRLQFLGINEIGVERDGVGFAKKLHQSAILFDQIVLPARRPARCDACAGVSNRPRSPHATGWCRHRSNRSGPRPGRAVHGCSWLARSSGAGVDPSSRTTN